MQKISLEAETKFPERNALVYVLCTYSYSEVEGFFLLASSYGDIISSSLYHQRYGERGMESLGSEEKQGLKELEENLY